MVENTTIYPVKDFILAEGMPADARLALADCLAVWYSNLARNLERYKYYEGENRLKDFGISTPPELLHTNTVIGWPNKAVMAVALRSRYDGAAAENAETQQQLRAIERRSRLATKYRQAVESELVYGCSFAIVGLDDKGKSRIEFYDAEHAAGVWDDARGRIAYGCVFDVNTNGGIERIRLFMDDATYTIERTGTGAAMSWTAEPHGMGRCCMEALAYRPTLKKPLGQSRISHAVMSITDAAVRCALGGDISFQFAVAPQKYILGADPEALDGMSKWEAYIGNIFGIGYNGDADKMPQFGQLSQASMQQYVDYMRSLAARFSGETDVPVSQLGIIHDNPSSAQAIYAATEPLVLAVDDLNNNSRQALEQLLTMALAAERGIAFDEVQEEVSVSFANPSTPSVVTMADSAVKLAAAVPAFAGTTQFWKMMGVADDVRRQIEAQTDKAAALKLLDSLNGGADA